jgi:hypothetical protein
LFKGSLDFGRTEGQFRTGCDGGEGPVVVQKKKEIPGLPDSGLNVSPVFEKMFHKRYYSLFSIPRIFLSLRTVFDPAYSGVKARVRKPDQNLTLTLTVDFPFVYGFAV